MGLRARLVLALVAVAAATGVSAVVVAVVGLDRYLASSGGYGTADTQLGYVAQLAVDQLALAVLGLLLLSVLLALLVAGRVLRPVRRLAAAVDRLAAGDLGVRVPVRGRDEMAQLTAGFNRMALALELGVDELRRAEARSRRFAADVSHELRTPLAAVTAVADVLVDETAGLDGNAAAAARLVRTETHHLTRLVDDLAEMSRFDAGRAALRLEDVDVVAAVRTCLEVRGWAGEVAVDAPPRLVAPVDPRRLEVIVANLAGNALRHGAPPVVVRVRELGVGGRAELAVEVSDRGPGLAPDVLPHVFERFFKADTARGRSDGSGLGLALVAENARLHGGTVTAANRPDGGAAFTALVPLGPR